MYELYSDYFNLYSAYTVEAAFHPVSLKKKLILYVT